MASQFLVLIMNVVFLRGFSYAAGAFFVLVTKKGTSVWSILFTYFALIAYLRVASHFDELLGQLGMNAAKTGAGPLGELGGALIALRPVTHALAGAFGLGASKGAGVAGRVFGSGGSGTAATVIGGGPKGAAESFVSRFTPGAFKAKALGDTSKKTVGGLYGLGMTAAARASLAT